MKNRAEPKNAADKTDALDLLTADHDAVKKLFKEFWYLLDGGASARSGEAKEALVRKACNALILHSKIEEDIFYPAVRSGLGDDELMDEARVEHDSTAELINQLLASHPGDELYDAKFVVLSEQTLLHIRMEEGNMFPRAKDAGIDMIGLGRQLKKRKAALEAELAQGGGATGTAGITDLAAKRDKEGRERLGLPT